MRNFILSAAVAMLITNTDAALLRNMNQAGVNQIKQDVQALAQSKTGNPQPRKLAQSKQQAKKLNLAQSESKKTKIGKVFAQIPPVKSEFAQTKGKSSESIEALIQGWSVECVTQENGWDYCYYYCDGTDCDVLPWEEDNDYGGFDMYGEEGDMATGQAEDDGIDYSGHIEGDELAAFNKIQLDAHNEYRALHGTPPLAYDAGIAAGAQEWSESMLATDKMEHSSGTGLGENLAWMGGSNVAKIMRTTPEATKMWYDEFINPGYDFASPGFSYGTGHFTQVIWSTTTKLGCGSAGGYVTCRYDPPGNMDMPGQFEKNVLPLA